MRFEFPVNAFNCTNIRLFKSGKFKLLVDLEEFGSYTFIFASNRTTSSLDLWIYEDKALDILTKTKKFSLNSNPSFQGISNYHIIEEKRKIRTICRE